MKRIELDGKVTGVYADYHYVGTGDIGGAAPSKRQAAGSDRRRKAPRCCPRPAAAVAVAREAGTLLQARRSRSAKGRCTW